MRGTLEAGIRKKIDRELYDSSLRQPQTVGYKTTFPLKRLCRHRHESCQYRNKDVWASLRYDELGDVPSTRGKGEKTGLHRHQTDGGMYASLAAFRTPELSLCTASLAFFASFVFTNTTQSNTTQFVSHGNAHQKLFGVGFDVGCVDHRQTHLLRVSSVYHEPIDYST